MIGDYITKDEELPERCYSAWQTLVTNLGFKAIPSHANREAYKQYMGQPYNFLKLKIHIGQHLVLCLTKIDQEA